jgi:hypothetical protein
MPPRFGYYEEFDFTFNPRNFISISDSRLLQKVLLEDPLRWESKNPDLRDGEFDHLFEELFTEEWDNTVDKDEIIKDILKNIQITQKKSLRIFNLNKDVKGADRGLLDSMKLTRNEYSEWFYTYHKNFDYCATKSNLKRYGKLVDSAFENSDVVTIDINSELHPYNAILNESVMSNVNSELTKKASSLNMTLGEYKSSWGSFPTSSNSINPPVYDFDGTLWEPGNDYYYKPLRTILVNEANIPPQVLRVPGQSNSQLVYYNDFVAATSGNLDRIRKGNESTAASALAQKIDEVELAEENLRNARIEYAVAENYLRELIASPRPEQWRVNDASNSLIRARAAIPIAQAELNEAEFILERVKANIHNPIPNACEITVSDTVYNPYLENSDEDRLRKEAEDALKEAADALKAAEAAASAAKAKADADKAKADADKAKADADAKKLNKPTEKLSDTVLQWFENLTLEKLNDDILYIWEEYKIQSIVAIVVLILLFLSLFFKSSPPPIQYIISKFGKIF